MTDKLEVNGEGRHPLFDVLTEATDPAGHTGDVRWNFEKWLVAPTGTVIARFAPKTEPLDASVLAAIDASVA